MFDNNYINPEFTEYLNRYCKGIVFLKDKLKKISIAFELSEAFSNYSCRFSIDIDFLDSQTLSENERQMANKYFHNMWNDTGSRFVSFSYKPTRGYNIDVEEIRSFIIHYQFAQILFEGFIKDLIPENCTLEIAPLDKEPLFNYSKYFLSHSKYAKGDDRSFEKEYFLITKRKFEFDLYYHKKLVLAAEKFPEIEIENSISDKEICKTQNCDMGDLRRYILEEKIPFNKSKYSNVIDEIRIDINVLKSKIRNYMSGNFTKINPDSILQLIEQKKAVQISNQLLINNIKQNSGVECGDYIVVETDRWGKEILEFGLIKEINLNYNQELEIIYNLLKKDFSESKLPHRTAHIHNISYLLKPGKLQKKEEYFIAKKVRALTLFEKEGQKNPVFKTKTTKSK